MTADLTFVATCDLIALTRGRSVPTADYGRRLATGLGWMPNNLALTTFGDNVEPNAFGALGDLRLIPDDAARLTLPADGRRPATDLVLANLTTPDGAPWACDLRHALAEATAALARRGLRLLVAFEQEFRLRDGPFAAPGAVPGSIEAHRRAEPFGTALVAALREGGLEPETWLPEFGSGHYEITIAPTDPVAAADRAILVRALVRDLAVAHGFRATFAPKVHPDAAGNGVHVHWSLWEGDRPVTLGADLALTPAAGAFAAGLIAHGPALAAWTAPSVISPLRFGHRRWGAAAAFVGRQNREAMVRICPTPTVGGADPVRGANLEYRAADASANPWLVLAAILRAGLDGLDRRLPAPPVLAGELDALDAATRERLGIVALPTDAEAALAALEADAAARGWFAPDLVATHVAIRRTELARLAGASPAECCARYADVL